MYRFAVLFLLIFLGLNAAELPKLYSQLGDPLFHAAKQMQKLPKLRTLYEQSEAYIKEANSVRQMGLHAQNSSGAKEKKLYLKRLRKLQKRYDYVLHILHDKINQSIDREDYILFGELTSYEFDGLLKNKALYDKATAFYEGQKKIHANAILDKKIRTKNLIRQTSEEFLTSPVTQNLNSKNFAKRKKSKRKVDIYVVRNQNIFNFIIENKNFYAVTVTIEGNYSGMQILQGKGKRVVVHGRSKLLYMKAKAVTDKIEFNFSYKSMIGSIYAKHENSYIYKLPYHKGEAYRVSQGYNGKYTHKGHSQYAIDFMMDIGTKIYAAREGRVVKIKEDSDKHGYAEKYAKYGNYVIVAHADGTFGTYYHLRKNGVEVKPGDFVNKGDFLGYSGNTGYTSGPHLHFAVFKDKGGTTTESLPIKFRSARGIITKPIVGEYYKAQ